MHSMAYLLAVLRYSPMQSPDGDAPLLDIDLEWDLPDFSTVGMIITPSISSISSISYMDSSKI